MANKQDILRILRRAIGDKLTILELETLADSIASSSGGSGRSASSAEATEDAEKELKVQAELARKLGDVADARQKEAQILQNRRSEVKKIIQADIELGKVNEESIKQYRELTRQIELYARANEEAATTGGAFSAMAESAAGSLLSLNDNGTTLLGMYTAFNDIMMKSTLNLEQQKQAQDQVSQAASGLEKEQAELVGVMGELDTATQGMTTASEDASKGLKSMGNTAGGAKQILASLVNSRFGQKIQRMMDPVNQTVNLFQIASGMAQNLERENLALYQSTGLVGKGGRMLTFEIGKMSKGLKSLSLTSKELTTSFNALYTGYMGAHKLTDQQVQSFTRATAVLEQAGMSADVATQNYQFFRTALGETHEQALQSNREIMGLAKALKAPPNEIAQAYAEAQKSMSIYGKNFKKDMKAMIAISRKLKISVGAITGAFDKLDIYENAASFTGRLNAIAGGAVLNAKQIMVADMPQRARIFGDYLKTLKDRGMDLTDPKNRGITRDIAETSGLDRDILMKYIQETQDSGGDFSETMKIAQNAQAKRDEDLASLNYDQLDAETRANLNMEKSIGFMTPMISDIRTGVADMVFYIRAVGVTLSAVYAFMMIQALRKGAASATGGLTQGGRVAGSFAKGLQTGGIGSALLGAGVQATMKSVIVANVSAIPVALTIENAMMLGRTIASQLAPIVARMQAAGTQMNMAAQTDAASTKTNAAAATTNSVTSRTNVVASKTMMSAAFKNMLIGGGIVGAIGLIGYGLYSWLKEDEETKKAREKREKKEREENARIRRQESNWATMSIEEKASYAQMNQGLTPMGTAAGISSIKPPMAGDFKFDMSRVVRADYRDSLEIVGSRSGGTMDGNMKEMISLLRKLVQKDTVIELDGKKVSRGVVKQINSTYGN